MKAKSSAATGPFRIPRHHASVMGATQLELDSVALEVDSILRSVADMLRLESISSGRLLPGPKKNNVNPPNRPRIYRESVLVGALIWSMSLSDLRS